MVTVKAFLINLFSYLSKDKIALGFLSFMVAVLILEIIKECLVSWYKKQEAHGHRCRFLQESSEGLSCTHRSHKNRFKKLNGSCDGCYGRTITMSKEDAEERASKSNRVVAALFIIAKAGKGLLPYISILFTLLSAMSLSSTTIT